MDTYTHRHTHGHTHTGTHLRSPAADLSEGSRSPPRKSRKHSRLEKDKSKHKRRKKESSKEGKRDINTAQDDEMGEQPGKALEGVADPQGVLPCLHACFALSACYTDTTKC